jgi:hypothetical protein
MLHSKQKEALLFKKYGKIIQILRDTLVECGGKPLYKPEDYGVNPYHGKTDDGCVYILTDFGSVNRLETPEGGIEPYGSAIGASAPNFFQLLTERLNLEQFGTQKHLKDCHYSPSGPRYKIRIPLD